MYFYIKAPNFSTQHKKCVVDLSVAMQDDKLSCSQCWEGISNGTHLQNSTMFPLNCAFTYLASRIIKPQINHASKRTCVALSCQFHCWGFVFPLRFCHINFHWREELFHKGFFPYFAITKQLWSAMVRAHMGKSQGFLLFWAKAKVAAATHWNPEFLCCPL